MAPLHHVDVTSAGFDPVHMTATIPMEIFLFMSDNYVGSDKVCRRMHDQRKRLEMALVKSGQSKLKNDIYPNLAALGVGREAVDYARRTEDE